MKHLHASAAEIPGLPTREELQAMVVEHDAIEKETEVFDTGELKKLRQLTKGISEIIFDYNDIDFCFFKPQRSEICRQRILT